MQWKEGTETTMWDFYKEWWLPFGELLTEMEKEGIKVNTDYLKAIEQTAEKDYEENKVS